MLFIPEVYHRAPVKEVLLHCNKNRLNWFYEHWTKKYFSVKLELVKQVPLYQPISRLSDIPSFLAWYSGIVLFGPGERKSSENSYADGFSSRESGKERISTPFIAA